MNLKAVEIFLFEILVFEIFLFKILVFEILRFEIHVLLQIFTVEIQKPSH